MRKFLSFILLTGSVCLSSTAATLCAATIHEIDGSTITGDPVSLTDGTLKIAIKSDPSTTQPTTQPTALPISQIVRIVFRAPTPKAPAPPPVEPPPESDSNDNSPGIMSSVIQLLSGSNGNSPSNAPAVVNKSDVASNGKQIASSSTTAPSSQPSQIARWQARLFTGDILKGTIRHWADGKFTIKLSAVNTKPIEIPIEQLAQLWCDDAEACKKARALNIQAGPDDVVFVRKDAQIISLTGVAPGIEGDSLKFRYEDQDRKISLTKLVGYIQGDNGRHAPPQKFHQLVRLDSGDEVSGTWTGLSASALSMRTNWGAVLRLPLKRVDTIEFLDGRLVYLSDLKPDQVEQTPYFGRVMPWRADRSLSGGTLKMSDGEYDKGIAVHTRCVLEYDTAGAFQRFQTKVGFEQPAGNKGRAVIRVIGDGKILYENLDARGEQPPVTLDLDISSTQKLTLEVNFGKFPDVGGRLIWANARLLRASLPE